MKRTTFALACLCLFGSGALHAAVYKGQKVYMKQCRECHGGGQEVAGSKTISTWNELMNNSGEKLADLHLESKEAEASWEYFDSNKYRKRAKHLKDFMVEYAEDSGNVPACSD